MKNSKNRVLFIILISIFFLQSLYVLKVIITGVIPFWYDPARDFLLAWNNLHKITFIGPPSGIPGFFYGPYWIWLISLGLIFSKDPRVVVFLILTIPYFIFFPFILYKFRNIFRKTTLFLMWLLFILGFNIYSFYLWNPHLAPFFTLIVIFFIMQADFSKSKKTYLQFLGAGIAAGLVLNFHLSFGLGLTISCVLFFILYSLRYMKKKFRKQSLVYDTSFLAIFIFGILTTFTPFFIFESRHGFNQLKVVKNTIFSTNAVVGQTSMPKSEILGSFFGILGKILEVPGNILPYISITIIGIAIIEFRLKRMIIYPNEKKLLLLLFSTLMGILFLYLTSKNPIWEYHFIGVEILFLFFLGFTVNKFTWIRYLLVVWVSILVLIHVMSFIKDLDQSPYKNSSLVTKEKIVDIVKNDAGNVPYTVFIYNPAIYTYDYSYLFKWQAHKDIPFDPGEIKREGDLVYLIIQPTAKSKELDFMHKYIPSSKYKIEKIWTIEDGTKIIKAEQLNVK